MTYQVRVVFLMILPELGGNWYYNRAVGGYSQTFVPEGLFQCQEMADLMLC